MSKILSAPTLPKEKLTSPLPEKFKIHRLIYNFTRSRLFAIIVLHNLFLILFGIFANIDCQILFLHLSVPPIRGKAAFRTSCLPRGGAKGIFTREKERGERGVSGNDPNRLLLRGEKGPGKK